LLRQAGKCARNPQCRNEVAERAERLAQRIRKLAVELARLDKLEAQSARRGVQCSELERELNALRAVYQ